MAHKKALALSKPKKESIGPQCPICDVRDPPREHVARHFGDELSIFVANLGTGLECPDCSYKGEKMKNLELHIALVHGQLDIFLKNVELVHSKRDKFMMTPKKQTIGPKCPICDMAFTKSQNRDHVAWHFMAEMREYVQSFPDPMKCIYCNYTNEKIDNLVKHVALGHSKLDELLQDEDLVAAKRAKALSKPKKMAIGPVCPICNVKEPAREHVARHFSDELMVYINEFEDKTSCNECDYKGDKSKTLAIHVALVHGKLDLILLNQELVDLKRAKYLAKPKKQTIGPKCPVCDLQFTKNQNRDHVAWHYIEELRAIVQQFPDPLQCTQCPYVTDSTEKMVKHVALGHSMLDGFLQDQELLEHKRARAMSKPKKVALGPTCPICDIADPPREHVARHFGDELLELVHQFPDDRQCTECSYNNDKPKNVAIHIALVHNILDQILSKEDLVKSKREKFLAKPQKVNVGNQCPICEVPFTKGQNRDHVCWHFMEELREYVMTFPDREACNECSYRSEKLDNLVKHVALGHSKLDELLSDEALVSQKKEIAMSKPKKINIGPSCPVCELKFTKGQNRDHVSWHFMPEMRDFVRSTGYEKSCTFCNYTTDKLDNLVKHYALGHSKLDEYLLDEELIQAKKAQLKKKPKRMSFGKDCPICGQTGRDRDHIARHFMTELMELVNLLPKKSKCDQCEYSNSRADYMAKHIALFHCKLDEFMQDAELVASKKELVEKQPKKISMGEACLICGISMPSREHVARHFLPELCQIVLEKSASPLSCPECQFTADKPEYVARHMGLVHCKVDELVGKEELVERKKTEYQGSLGANGAGASALLAGLPPKSLPMREAVRKSQRQREAEERQAQEEKLRMEREREAREREKEERRRRKEENALKAQKEAEMKAKEAAKTLLSKKPETKPKPISPMAKSAAKSLLEKTLRSPPKPSPNPGSSLLLATLMKKDPHEVSNIAKAEPEQEEEEDENWQIEAPKNDGSLSIKIKRTSPSSKKSNVMQQQQQFSPNNDNNDMVVEPDFSQFMQISHNMDEEDGEENHGDEEEEEEGTPIIIEPQIFLDNDDHNDFGDYEEENEFCDFCGFELIGEHEANCDGTGRFYPAKKRVKYSECPICNLSPDPSREHIARHFLPELMEVVECFPDPMTCPQCEFTSKKSSANVGLHIAIAHSQLEKYLKDKKLVASKKHELYGTNPHQTIQSDGVIANLAPSVTITRTKATSAPSTSFVQQVLCPICDQSLNKSHSRDHISWHFISNLRALINEENKCPQCNYTGEKSDNVARHLALFHGQLDVFLQDEALVREKRYKALSKPKKAHIGPLCPVCDFKDPPREHVSRHFMPELMGHLETLPDQLQCGECNYRGEKPQNLAKHIALVHSLLDEMLHNDALVRQKRAQVMSKPKKVSIGDHCPVCDLAIPKRDSRVHVIWHFMDDLRQMVASFANQRICDICGYQNQRPDKMAKHLALGHSKLDELLMDEELVQLKREIAFNKPKKLVLGNQCPICDMQFNKAQNRDHVAWHFMEELRDIVTAFEDPKSCNQCQYVTDKVDNLVKHIALGHSKLDELMQDEELVAAKRQQALSKTRKISIGPSCPICDLTFTRGPNRDHVSWHFSEELREIVNSYADPTSCQKCEYRAEKMENMIKHLALGHSMLDQFLQDTELVALKREKAQNKPKKYNLGEVCPICDYVRPQRDHVVRHFFNDLMDFVADDKLSCLECEYRAEKSEYVAKHVGLHHGHLDQLLYNAELVRDRRNEYLIKSQQQTNEFKCAVCDKTMPRKSLREHCAKHFAAEINEYIEAAFDDAPSGRCQLCEGQYRNVKRESLIRHVALVHGKLDELLADEEYVEKKRSDYFAELDNGEQQQQQLKRPAATQQVIGADVRISPRKRAKY